MANPSLKLTPVSQPLRDTPSYDANGVALLPPMAPGDRLWPRLLEMAAARQQSQAAGAMSTLAPAGATPVPSQSSSGQVAVQPAAMSCAPGSAAAAAGEAAVLQPAAPQRMVAVVLGPPLSGVTTQARLLASRYGVPMVDLDTLVQVQRQPDVGH